MRKPSRHFAFAAALWLACVAAASGLVSSAEDHERQALFERFEARADTGASFVAAYVQDVFGIEERLAGRVMDDAAQRAAFAGTVELMGFTAAVLLDDRGRALALAPDNPEMQGAELASKYQHLSAALAGERAVSDIVPSAVKSEPIVAFALPLTGEFGVLSAGFSLEDSPLKAFLERQPIAGTRGYILDSAGTVIVSAGDGAAEGLSKLDLPTTSQASVTDGRLLASMPVPGTSWTYLLDAPLAEVLSPLEASGIDEWTVLAGVAALTLVGLLMTAGALSARKRARESQAEADRRFRLTVQHAPIGMTMVSMDYKFVEPNARLCHMLGYSADVLETMTFAEVTHAEDLDVDLEHVQQLVAGESDSYELDKRYVHKDGSFLWGRLTVSAVRNDEDKPLYFVSQIEDVTSLRASQEDLERRAMYDPLTGLANRGLLLDRLDLVLHSRASTTVAVAFCDVDFFKSINDSEGHHAGDAVLREVADRFRQTVRKDDTVARMGGDEFVLLLTEPGTVEEASQAVERARRAAVGKPIEVDGTFVTVSISGGLAFAEPGDSADSLLRKADTALYAAKAAGRGRIEVYDIPSSSLWIETDARGLHVSPVETR